MIIEVSFRAKMQHRHKRCSCHRILSLESRNVVRTVSKVQVASLHELCTVTTIICTGVYHDTFGGCETLPPLSIRPESRNWLRPHLHVRNRSPTPGSPCGQNRKRKAPAVRETAIGALS